MIFNWQNLVVPSSDFQANLSRYHQMVHQIESTKDHAKHCLENMCTLYKMYVMKIMALQNILFRNLSCWFDYVSVRKMSYLHTSNCFLHTIRLCIAFPIFHWKTWVWNLSYRRSWTFCSQLTALQSQLILNLSANLLLIDLIVYSKSCKTSLSTNSSNVFTNLFHEFFPRICCWKMVFCYQNCSDLLWEKKMFQWSRKTSLEQFIQTVSESSEQFLITEYFFNTFLEVSYVK
jgi:hypothetical protein